MMENINDFESLVGFPVIQATVWIIFLTRVLNFIYSDNFQRTVKASILKINKFFESIRVEGFEPSLRLQKFGLWIMFIASSYFSLIFILTCIILTVLLFDARYAGFFTTFTILLLFTLYWLAALKYISDSIKVRRQIKAL